jgi:hypothetical protein
LIEGVMDNKKNLEHVFRPETASAGGFFISRHVRYEYKAAVVIWLLDEHLLKR